MSLYKNIKTNVVFDWSDAHWEDVPNKKHFEKVEEAESKVPPKKKAARKKAKKK